MVDILRDVGMFGVMMFIALYIDQIDSILFDLSSLSIPEIRFLRIALIAIAFGYLLRTLVRKEKEDDIRARGGMY